MKGTVFPKDIDHGGRGVLLVIVMSQLIHQEDANTLWHANVPCIAYRIQSLTIIQ